MFEPDIRDILSELLTKSEAGEVKWLESEAAGMAETAPGGDYVVLMPNSSINVFRVNENPRVNFIDSHGDVSLSLSAETEEDRDLIEQVIASAKKAIDAPRLRKIHQTLADIKTALRQEGVVGETNPRNFMPLG